MARDEKKRKRSLLGTLAFVAWVISGLGFALLLYVHTPRAAALLPDLDLALPTLTEVMLTIGSWLRSNEGLMVAAGILTASLLPFALGFALRQAVKLYSAAAVLGLVGIGLTWLGLIQPVDVLMKHLAPSAPGAEAPAKPGAGR